MTTTTATKTNTDSPWANLIFNIALPTLLLNKLTPILAERWGENGPAAALLLSLALPLGYGAYDYFKRGKKNAISLLGFLNILFTGGLALLKLEGIWFAVKEAAFPLLIGVFVLFSVYSRKPFIEVFVYNDRLLNLALIEEKLKSSGNHTALHRHLRRSTIFLSGSFFLSSLLNFVLARVIFTDLDTALSATEKASLLNGQIADMTWLSWIVIVIPSMLCLSAILWHLISGLQKLTGLKFNDLMNPQLH